MISPVPLDQIEWYWPIAEPVLDRAFEHSESDTASMHKRALLDDLEQLWCIDNEAWALTRVVSGKSGRVFEFVALAGEQMKRWKREFFDSAESWAKSHGCVRAMFTGRRGWANVLPDYQEKTVTMVKEL